MSIRDLDPVEFPVYEADIMAREAARKAITDPTPAQTYRWLVTNKIEFLAINHGERFNDEQRADVWQHTVHVLVDMLTEQQRVEFMAKVEEMFDKQRDDRRFFRNCVRDA